MGHANVDFPRSAPLIVPQNDNTRTFQERINNEIVHNELVIRALNFYLREEREFDDQEVNEMDSQHGKNEWGRLGISDRILRHDGS